MAPTDELGEIGRAAAEPAIAKTNNALSTTNNALSTTNNALSTTNNATNYAELRAFAIGFNCA